MIIPKYIPHLLEKRFISFLDTESDVKTEYKYFFPFQGYKEQVRASEPFYKNDEPRQLTFQDFWFVEKELKRNGYRYNLQKFRHALNK